MKRKLSIILVLLLLMVAVAPLNASIGAMKSVSFEEHSSRIPNWNSDMKAHSTDSEQPPTEWNRTFGGNYIDRGHSLVQTSDDGYAIAGETDSYGAGYQDFWLIKTDSSGNELWNQTYGGSDADRAYSIAKTTDDGYVLAGHTGSYDAGLYDFWLIKTDSDGNAQWNKTYGGTNNDIATSVVQTSDGGYALAGDSYGAGGYDFWLIKTDSDGNAQWNKTYGGTNNDFARSLVQTSDGGYAIAGYTSSYGVGRNDFWLIKTDADGNALWNKTYGGTESDIATSVVQASDEGYAIAGYINSYGAGLYDFWLIKIDTSGNAQWNKTYGGTNDDIAYSVVQTSDGGYAIAGDSSSYGAGGYDFWLIKTDSSGNALWNQTYGGTESDIAHALLQTSDGGYAIAGYTASYGVGFDDIWLIKTGKEGETELHDVSVTNVNPSKTFVGQNYAVNITVIVTNQGDYPESFDVIAYANTTVIGTFTDVTLASGESTTLPLSWNTASFLKGDYTVSAYATPVPSEADTLDNTYKDGNIKITIAGDVNGDTTVNVHDLFLIGKAYDSTPPTNTNCDINEDSTVNQQDLHITADNYSKTA